MSDILERVNTTAAAWSEEPRIIMWFLNPQGQLIRHNFYHSNRSDVAIDRAQFYEYELGFATWLEYRPSA